MGFQYIGRGEVINLLRKLVSMESINPFIDPENGKGEKAIAEFCCQWLKQKGIKTWVDEIKPGRTNTVAEFGDGDGPTLVLYAHLDTVGVTGMTIQPFDPKIENGRLFGRGSYDMKAGAASIMACAAELAKTKLNGKLMLALVCDEEYTSIGAQDFVKKYKADACILTEPTEENIVIAHKGFVWFEITTKGRAEHGSRWDIGKSAISSMGRIINALSKFDETVLRNRTHELVGPASMHCSVIKGGSAESVYAAECKMRVERRTLPGEKITEVTDEIKGLVKDIDPTAELETIIHRNPAQCSEDEKILQCLHEAYKKIKGSATENTGVEYWMDMAIFSEADIPTADIGIIGEGAHSNIEWADVDSLIRCTEILVETCKRFF
jgi:acetylornithine deacetylase/succinyl-diaminopimelate desuccinylase family protein